MINETVKYLMGLKKSVGEFSLDLYYNDVAREEEAFVVRVQFVNGYVEHFRTESFEKSLIQALEYFVSILSSK